MLLYIVLVFSWCAQLNCMDSLITHTPPHFFENLTVLSYDADEYHAAYIAKSALLVHSDSTQKDTTTIASNQKKYCHVKNLFFRKPQHNIYDLITVYNPYMLNKSNIIVHLKTIYDYLSCTGNFYGLLRTQTNHYSLAHKAFFNTYSKIYQSTSDNSKEALQEKSLPSLKDLKSEDFTDDELKEIIWSNGYRIISYENKTYKTVIENEVQHQQDLKTAFRNNLHKLQVSEEEAMILTREFVNNAIKKYKRNKYNQLIECWNFTKIKLCKAENPRPPIYINASLLAEDYKKL